jgi:hypothetical protein
MSLVTRQYGPDAKGSKLTNLDMDNNLYYLQSLGVSGMTFSANTLTLTNPTGGIIANALIDINADSRWYIPSGSTVEIGSYSQSFVYGDLYVLGELILNDNSQLIILNGNLILSGGTITVSGSGQTVLVDLPTFGDLITSGTYSGGTLTLSTSNGTDVTVNGFFTGSTDVFTTGVTYDNLTNTITLTDNTNTTFNAYIDSVSGLTVNGDLKSNTISATTISGTTLYGNGSNITGLSTQDTFVTGGTYSAGTATFVNNTGGTFSVSGFTIGLPYTIYKALVTLSSGTFTITQLANTIGDGSNTSPNDIVWSNPSNGVIRATKSGAFTSSNILINVENINGGGVPYICTGQKSTSNFISISIFLHDGTLSSTPNFTNLPVEIRIY